MALASWHEIKPLMNVIGSPWIFYVGIWFGMFSTLGCLRVLSLDYQATNSIQGQGTVHLVGFHYQPADEQRVRPREVETPTRSEGKIFLSETIGTVFSKALQSELMQSGFTITDSSPRSVSGVVTRFYLDWTKERERTFVLDVTYSVQSDGRQPFSWRCSSLRRGSDMLEEDALLIKAGIADCMQHFLLAAREAQVL